MPEALCLVVIVVAVATLSPGCRTASDLQSPKKPKRERTKQQEKVVEPSRDARPIGKIVHVDTQYGFVLVDVGLLTGFNAGTEIQSRDGETVTAVLKISPQALRPFLTADVVSGSPAIGNVVYK